MEFRLIFYLSFIVCPALLFSDTPPPSVNPTTSATLQKTDLNYVASYIYTNLREGKAEELKTDINEIKKEVVNNQFSKDTLKVIRKNLKLLIAISKQMVKEQKFSDPYTEIDQKKEEKLREAILKKLEEEKSNSTSVQGKVTVSDYIPPKHDRVFNEKKKDLIQASYKLLGVVRHKIRYKKKAVDAELLKDETEKDMILRYLEEMRPNTSISTNG